MNFDKRHNVFSDIPGIDASKGERIIKALKRLWEKIEHLQQIRNYERNSKSKEELSSSVDEDPTISDVQYKLLLLQLQYVRSILRKNEAGRTASRETQTGTSLIRDHSPPTKDTRVSEALPNTSKGGERNLHYHLKLDDIPFILGASSGASHSVVANMQNIIALMKGHNKGLCGTSAREQHQKQPEADADPTHPITSDHLPTKQMAQTGHKHAPDQRKSKKKVGISRCRSNSDCSSLPANERKLAAMPANERPVRMVPNPPIAGRRQFLRSLQNFKSHLSEEDISWN